jgi:hypothetical protein
MEEGFGIGEVYGIESCDTLDIPIRKTRKLGNRGISHIDGLPRRGHQGIPHHILTLAHVRAINHDRVEVKFCSHAKLGRDSVQRTWHELSGLWEVFCGEVEVIAAFDQY